MKNASISSYNTSYEVKHLHFNDLTPKDIEEWKELETTATEPNAYLSPHFVLPALKYLENESRITFVTVRKVAIGLSSLVGLAILKKYNFSRYLPLPHVSFFHTRHSYLSGIFAHKEYIQEVVPILLRNITNFQVSQYGIEVEETSADGNLYLLISDIFKNLGFRWFPYKEWQRKTLPVNQAKNVQQNFSKRLNKNFKRNLRKIGELGEVSWGIISHGDVNAAYIQEFLELENMGWKGKRKSSLYSNPNAVLFFQEMIQNFNRENKAYFMRLTLNDKAIASNSNFISGNVGFAFKIGWDVNYAKYSPGVLNEILFLESVNNKFDHVDYFDSGTYGESFIDSIWA
ncbi:MAG TPA: hypothetical protein DHW49_02995, partial [Anaerolineae bacterium]|nr:hypothetical protein [Anaerolineae bacterium]